jgi:predicted AAA+ superfamily ATPase
LKQFIHELRLNYNIQKDAIISFDFNDPLLCKINYLDLYKDIINKSHKQKTNYVFLDEIQEVKNFEKCVIGLFEHKTIKYDIYITGSNSHMFSRELATLFTGRSQEIKVYPFSFREYFNAFKKKYTYKTKAFYMYMKYGGLPAIFEFMGNDEQIKEKLSNIFYDCLQKDVETRHNIRNHSEFKKISKYLFDNIGQQISTFNIANTLKSKNKTNISPNTINRYID